MTVRPTTPNKGVTIAKSTRRRIYERFGYRCAHCDSKPPELTLDHQFPRTLGGRQVEANLMPACPRCNQKRGPSLELPFGCTLIGFAFAPEAL